MTLPRAVPRVSVLLPVYNAEEYVPAMLESLRRQTPSDFEVIMVDDGSTDRSGVFLEQAAAADARFRLIRQAANTGIFAALNRGLDERRAPDIARMDADDIALPDRFERQVAHPEASPDILALGTSLAYIDARGRSLNRVCRTALGGSMLRGNPPLHPTVMLRRSLLEQHAIRYRAEYIYADDYFLWLELSRLGRLAALDEVADLYRGMQHDPAISQAAQHDPGNAARQADRVAAAGAEADAGRPVRHGDRIGAVVRSAAPGAAGLPVGDLPLAQAAQTALPPVQASRPRSWTRPKRAGIHPPGAPSRMS